MKLAKYLRRLFWTKPNDEKTSSVTHYPSSSETEEVASSVDTSPSSSEHQDITPPSSPTTTEMNPWSVISPGHAVVRLFSYLSVIPGQNSLNLEERELDPIEEVAALEVEEPSSPVLRPTALPDLLATPPRRTWGRSSTPFPPKGTPPRATVGTLPLRW